MARRAARWARSCSRWRCHERHRGAVPAPRRRTASRLSPLPRHALGCAKGARSFVRLCRLRVPCPRTRRADHGELRSGRDIINAYGDDVRVAAVRSALARSARAGALAGRYEKHPGQRARDGGDTAGAHEDGRGRCALEQQAATGQAQPHAGQQAACRPCECFRRMA